MEIDWLEQGTRLVRDLFGVPSAEVERRVLDALQHGPLSSAKLAEATELGSASLYPTLLRLETAGKVRSDWQPGPYPRRRIYRLPSQEAPSDAAPQARTERDFEQHPYSPDEQRVVEWLVSRTKGMVGAGDDPIGFVLASYEHIMAERDELRKKAGFNEDGHI